MPRHHHIVQIQQKPIRNRTEHRLIHVGLQKTAYDRFVPQGVCYQCPKDIFIGQRFKRTPFDDSQLLFDIRHPRINCSAAFSGFQHFIDNTGCIEFDTVIIILPLLDKTNLKYGILLPGNPDTKVPAVFFLRNYDSLPDRLSDCPFPAIERK